MVIDVAPCKSKKIKAPRAAASLPPHPIPPNESVSQKKEKMGMAAAQLLGVFSALS